MQIFKTCVPKSIIQSVQVMGKLIAINVSSAMHWGKNAAVNICSSSHE